MPDTLPEAPSTGDQASRATSGLYSKAMNAFCVDEFVYYLGIASATTAVVCVFTPDLTRSGLVFVWAAGFRVVAGLLEVGLLRRFGATLGMSRAGIRLESATGRPLSAPRLLLRFVLGPMLLLPPVIFWVTAMRGTAFHDRVAGSRVVPDDRHEAVHDPSLRRRRITAVSLFLLVAVAAVLGLPAATGVMAELGVSGGDLPLGVRAGLSWARLLPLWGLASLLALALGCLPSRTPLDAASARWSLRWLWAMAVVMFCWAIGALLVGVQIAAALSA
jgi:uncharacterized RDD family membrane protein YckC